MSTEAASPKPSTDTNSPAYWAKSAPDVMRDLGTSQNGLTTIQATASRQRYGRNAIGTSGNATALQTFLAQFRSPLVLILIFAAVVSAMTGEVDEAIIIGIIVLASSILSFTQEYGASKAMQALKQRISNKAQVLRDGAEVSLPFDEVVPGDVIRLSAGNLVPADGIILGAVDFNVSEAALTGETFPVVKSPGMSPADATLSQRTNALFTGTSVRSGTATMLAVGTGNNTEFSAIAVAILRKPPETEFAKGIRLFGNLMTQIMLVMVIIVFFANLLLHRPLVDSLLFSLALAVGITPELLPAIISVTLARGARAMAANGVIVKRLDAIENLGSMDLLCTDKTGTLTEGVVRLDDCFDINGDASKDVTLWARLNAALQTGLKNPLDEAIAAGDGPDLSGFAKVGEIPYDFVRKCLSVIVRPKDNGPDMLICKGAVDNILSVCTSSVAAAGDQPLDAARHDALIEKFQNWSAKGYRVLGVAVRRFPAKETYVRADETGLSFAGFLLFLDPPKPDITATLKAFAQRGIAIKMITGDNRYVAAHLAETVGLRTKAILTGADLAKMSKDALFARAPNTDLFVEIDPNQKERIVEALRRAGHVVGYMGDGINDAPALHEADIGISVEGAVDVAREAADLILLKQDLSVLARGVDDGRKTFANTMKYISITTSASFGNMISMAIASLFLPFLPLLAIQILLNNFLSDVPSLAIATDNVDETQTRKPEHWDVSYVRRFMIRFGLISTVFDIITFGFLLWVGGFVANTFQSGWFVESLITELGIVMIVRTRKAFWKSKPGALLVWLSAAVTLLALAIPYLPVAGWFGMAPLPLPVMAGLIGITLLYLLASEATKSAFFKSENKRHQKRPKVRAIA